MLALTNQTGPISINSATLLFFSFAESPAPKKKGKEKERKKGRKKKKRTKEKRDTNYIHIFLRNYESMNYEWDFEYFSNVVNS